VQRCVSSGGREHHRGFDTDPALASTSGGRVSAALLIPYLTLATVLGVAGVQKLREPLDTVQALHALRLPDSRAAVRILGGLELGLALVSLALLGAPTAVLVALCYFGFALVIWRLMRSGTPLSSCGCLGSAEVPPSYFHVAFNLSAAVLAGLFALDPASLSLLWEGGPVLAVVAVMSIGICSYLAHAFVQWLPVVWPVGRQEDQVPSLA
jgi:methylamine utilization protein MauE